MICIRFSTKPLSIFGHSYLVIQNGLYVQSKLNEIGFKTNFILAFDLPKEALPSDLLKIYFWNPDKKEVEIGETKIYFEKD